MTEYFEMKRQIDETVAHLDALASSLPLVTELVTNENKIALEDAIRKVRDQLQVPAARPVTTGGRRSIDQDMNDPEFRAMFL